LGFGVGFGDLEFREGLEIWGLGLGFRVSARGPSPATRPPLAKRGVGELGLRVYGLW
jgi:hypothetical protein